MINPNLRRGPTRLHATRDHMIELVRTHCVRVVKGRVIILYVMYKSDRVGLSPLSMDKKRDPRTCMRSHIRERMYMYNTHRNNRSRHTSRQYNTLLLSIMLYIIYHDRVRLPTTRFTLNVYTTSTYITSRLANVITIHFKRVETSKCWNRYIPYKCVNRVICSYLRPTWIEQLSVGTGRLFYISTKYITSDMLIEKTKYSML
jgi:hypothetical protein